MKLGEVILSDNKAYSISIVIKTVLYWQRDKHSDQWKRTKSPEIKPHKYVQLFLIKWKNNSMEEG